ncbi:16301_t:CDS:2 [Dentiscutata heterogama]|uniref:16301_t:CDS:1 n=1 Tax=Dentiscutata heterogama TaxID=1316150 RepID=A0ACA9KVH0_9GLOM|nr:16301_t:CDS:2 [Dentiscutata heterogama]
MPLQPQSLDDIDILDSLCKTLSGENFLVGDFIIAPSRPSHLFFVNCIQFTLQALFQYLIEFVEENSLSLKPTTILTEFELARKIQENKLSIQYGKDENFSIKLRSLFALAFLLSNEISAAFDALKEEMPTETKDIVQWLENNYIYGKKIRQMHNGNISSAPPLYPPQMWSVHNSMELGIPQTQNIVEA